MKITLSTQDKLQITGSFIIVVLMSFWAYNKGGLEPLIALFVAMGSLFTLTFNGFLKSQRYEGKAEHYGTCGELVQGFLSETEPFHVTCPINKTSTVRAHIRKDFSPTITVPNGFSKMKKEATLALK